MPKTTGLKVTNELAKKSVDNGESLLKILSELLKEAQENVGGVK
jgi:hypothetical protein